MFLIMFRVFSIFLICTPVWGGFPYITPTKGRPWPLPQQEKPQNGEMSIDPTNFKFIILKNNCDILEQAIARYEKIISIKKPDSEQNEIKNEGFLKRLRTNQNSTILETGVLGSLEITLATPCEKYPHMDMDEQYELRICPEDQPTKATLVAQSIWGVLRGLETFSQILVANGSKYNVQCTQIRDYPRFSHRGLLIDTARHYLPMSKLYEVLDIMSLDKFNVFHWHITDDTSFPYQSEVYPELSKKGAYAPKLIYTIQDVKAIIEYARLRGIRVLPEFDTPGHTKSWGPGQEDLLTTCYAGGQPSGSYGPIDPSLENNYQFLRTLFDEIATLYPEYYLHLGGDEVSFTCWMTNPKITEFMSSLNITGNYAKLEEFYIQKLLGIVSTLSKPKGYMVWQEVFDNGVKLADDTIVHVWIGGANPYPEIQKVTKAGYSTLVSSCWYLNYIKYGIDWQQFYNCDPQNFNGTDEQKALVIGGEACMWGEYVDDANLISETWPRASTVAERLWSNKEATKSSQAAEARLEEHHCRLRRRGFKAQPIYVSFCEGVEY